MSEMNDELRQMQAQVLVLRNCPRDFLIGYQEITDGYVHQSRSAGRGQYLGLDNWDREDLEWRASELDKLNNLKASIPGFSEDAWRKLYDEVEREVALALAQERQSGQQKAAD